MRYHAPTWLIVWGHDPQTDIIGDFRWRTMNITTSCGKQESVCCADAGTLCREWRSAANACIGGKWRMIPKSNGREWRESTQSRKLLGYAPIAEALPNLAKCGARNACKRRGSGPMPTGYTLLRLPEFAGRRAVTSLWWMANAGARSITRRGLIS